MMRRAAVILALAVQSALCAAQQSATAPAAPAQPSLMGSLDREVPLTPPASSPKARPARKEMPADGSMVVDARMTLGQCDDEGWRLGQFDGQDQPRRLLPSSTLQAMEAIARTRPDTVFRVTGENTTYGNTSYLLITLAGVDRPTQPQEPAQQQAPQTSAETQSADGSRVVELTPATSHATPTTSPAPAGASADDIIAQLERDRPSTPVVVQPAPPEPAAPQQASVAPPPSQDVLPVGRGRTLVDQVVHIVPDEQGRWLEVRFVGDNTLRQPPMRLLPNTVLERAQLQRQSRNVPRRFRVTGVVETYQDQSYLLMRKALVERDLDQF